METSVTNEIILYQPNNTLKLNVRVEDETVWLNRNQIAELFGRDVKTIGKHITNALSEELYGIPTVAKFAIVQTEGNRTVTRNIEQYNLDMILSVGYRVKSPRGIQFRQWANKILKEHMLRGYSINQRFAQIEDRIDRRLLEHDQQLKSLTDKVDFVVKSSLTPREGILFEGQIFDAYYITSQLIRKATKRIVLIDNYVDETVFLQLAKRNPGVKATIYTHTISRQLHLDQQRHNSQYEPIDILTYRRAHDRFLIIDEEVYHLGASLKDLGKKLFAFSLSEEMTGTEFLSRL